MHTQLKYHISGIIRGKKVSRTTFFAIVHAKARNSGNLIYKNSSQDKNVRKHSQMLPDLQNLQKIFSVDDSHYTVIDDGSIS